MSEASFFDQDDQAYVIKASAVLLTYNGLPPDMWDAFLVWIPTILLENDEFSACHERAGSDHFHLYIHRPTQIDCKIDHFKFLDVTPNCSPNKCRGGGYATARDRGHFYVSCPYKTSYVAGFTTYPPAESYAVRSKWIVDLWMTRKLDRVLEACGHYHCLTPAVEAQVRLSEARRRQDERSEAKKQRRERILSSFGAFKPQPTVTQWREQYAHEMARYHFLVLWGPSKLGKTEYVCSLFTRPFIHNDSVSWSGYDPDVHDCIIFDDVKLIWKYVSDNRKLFQASSDVTVQTSATNVYSLVIDVTQKPLIITTNTAPMSDWVTANSQILEVTHPLWDETGV